MLKVNSRWLSLSGALATIVVGCSQAKQATETSTGKQLVENSFVCRPNSGRLPKVQTETTQYLKGGDNNYRNEAFDVFSEVPDDYLKWVFDQSHVAVTLQGEDGSDVRGVTQLEGDGTNWWPTSIDVQPPMGTFFGLLHEMGHAVEPYIARQNQKFEDDLAATYQKAVQQGMESAKMRDYARTQQAEYWAESFDSYYCSQPSRDYMQKNFPLTYALAQRYLIDPNSFATGTAPISGSATPDADGDGVPDSEDLCSNTPAGGDVWTDGEWKGCAAGQVRDHN